MDNTLVGHNHAKTALDVACWDAFGKSVDLPVCELLGGSTDLPLPMISSIHVGCLDAQFEKSGYDEVERRPNSPSPMAIPDRPHPDGDPGRYVDGRRAARGGAAGVTSVRPDNRLGAVRVRHAGRR